MIKYKKSITVNAKEYYYKRLIRNKQAAKEYFHLFNKTKISDMFFALDVKYVLGKSSIEIVKEVLEINNV